MIKAGGDTSPPVFACGGYYLRAAGGKISDGPIPCKRWDCKNPCCGPAKLKYYYALFCNGLGVKVDKDIPLGDDVMLMTLTTDTKKWNSPEQAFLQIGYTFRKFRQRVYRHYGKFEYICITEATKAGWPHLHIVCKGISRIPQGWYEEYLDTTTGAWERITKKEQKDGNQYRIIHYQSNDGRPTLSEMAADSGFGWVCDLREVKFDNSKGAANYLLGYLQKSLDSNKYPKNYRRVRWSEGWPKEDWQGPESTEGTGFVVPEPEELQVLKRYVQKGICNGFSPEGTISLINDIGPRKFARKLLRGLPIDFDASIDYSFDASASDFDSSLHSLPERE